MLASRQRNQRNTEQRMLPRWACGLEPQPSATYMLLWPGALGCVGDLSRSACKHANVLLRSVPTTCKQAPRSASTVEGRPMWDGGTCFNGAAVFWLS